MLIAMLLCIWSGTLADDLGRREVRVWSDVFAPKPAATATGMRLAERLRRLNYEAVDHQPREPGTYWVDEDLTWWIYRRAVRWGGNRWPALLFGLPFGSNLKTAVDTKGQSLSLGRKAGVWLEPERLAESLTGDRAQRVTFTLNDVPEHVWRAVVAAEDARFFDHLGLDGRALARSALANLEAGAVVQGGSTITQQLIKNRDLTPKRSFGRKASEAVRAMSLEAEYSKREILTEYVNHVYLGHVDGLAIHGMGTAAQAFFNKMPAELSLAQASLLAGIIQAPNRYNPLRHPKRAKARRDWVIDRMVALGWVTEQAAKDAQSQRVQIQLGALAGRDVDGLLSWLRALLQQERPNRMAAGYGVVVETTIDPLLQADTTRLVIQHLKGLRRQDDQQLQAAVVMLDADNGAVLAYVGGDPNQRAGRYDRARLARRQPGSTLKPLILLEAFGDCGWHRRLNPASRVADRPVRIALSGKDWTPGNNDGVFHGVVDIRESLRYSLNTPFVRIARHCGFKHCARKLRKAGIDLPANPPPSFVLGALETTLLDLTATYTPFVTLGHRQRPFPFWRMEKPSGRRLEQGGPNKNRVSQVDEAFIVRQLLMDAVRAGTGRRAAIAGLNVLGKTGTSSGGRDAWFIGAADGTVLGVWLGTDGGEGTAALSATRDAAPLWRMIMQLAAGSRPGYELQPPDDVTQAWVDTRSGLLITAEQAQGKSWARREWFHHRHLPGKKRWWLPGREAKVLD